MRQIVFDFPAIGVSWGFHPIAWLKASSPFRIVDHFKDLQSALPTRWPGFPL
jgi:hypothetical protein